MSEPVILTCAVTGGDDVASRYPQLPVTPAQIAQASVEAARAGAAIVHIHVRDPRTGKPSMAGEHYREVVQRIRDSGSDVIINLTTGPGARYVPALDQANGAAPGSNVRPPLERVNHVIELLPEICTLDMGSVNFGAGALINTASQIAAIAAAIPASVKIELEIFDTGHLALARKMIEDGTIAADSIFQFALGIPWGAPASTETMLLLRNAIGRDAIWAAFGIGRHEFPMVAQSLLLGGQIRVGLEDNFYLDKGVQAQSNAQLVDKAAAIAAALGHSLATPAQARRKLGLAAA
ncbi:3-keto-5-aminohexanoate cleavage protein [Bordetella sp. BOR01]|uniref:3-keto-5-aminohexanoate cleavage protein n=1 Tax=Bordetella sp. BOR01 TaxID=2854779 RepID=UPI001C481502|nr:3-keto-5-aminohexanoate cleavage protein [Bordetella sp. BOR01]MBV7485045.1 3-keto-5-aminohexanoate cleavage protein [Bordetella sp. BOR01]